MIRKLTLLAYAIAALVVVFDQISKWWILDVFHLPLKGSQPIIGPLSFTFVQNMGVSFGLMRADSWGRWVLVAFAAAVVVFLVIWAARLARPLAVSGVGLVIGGAIGNNLIDRVRFGYVVDFIDFGRLFPWVFNVADAAITVGVCLLLLDSLKRDKSPA